MTSGLTEKTILGVETVKERGARGFRQIVLGLAFSGLMAGAAAAAGEVNVYSSRHYPSDDTLYETFTKETGIKINVIQGKAEELMERMKLEGEASPADVLITVDAGNLWRAQEMDLFQSVTSQELESHIPENLREPSGKWFSFTKRARVFIYNPEKVKESDLSTYENLTDDAWKGRVLIRSSGNIYNQSLVASMIAQNGEEATEAWARGIVANMARPPEGGDTDQIKAVLAGVGDVAISNTYYFGRILNDKDKDLAASAAKLKLFFPNQDDRGTHVNVSGAGVAKNAPNRDNAVKFLEFLIGEEAQGIFAAANYEYPVRDGAAVSDTVKSWGSFKEDALHVENLGKHNSDAVKLMDRAGWK